MFFKTLIFLFILYMLVRGLRRFFLSSAGNKQSNARFFYQAFRNIQKQQKQQQDQQRQSQKKSGSNKFDEIEEADFEEIEDDQEKASD